MRAILFGLGLALTMTAPGWTQTPVIRHQNTTSPEEVVFLVPSTDIQCDGQAVQPTFSDDLRVETTGLSRRDRTAVSLLFSVDDTGRTFDIRSPQTTTPGPIRVIIPTDIASQQEQAALAAWRFDGPRRDCILTIRYAFKPLVEATTNDLLRYFAVTRIRGPIRDAVAARLVGPDANCGGDRRGGRAPRVVSYPDYKIGQRPPPGGQSWTVVRWDVDADGRAVNVETLGSAGDTAFDAETRRAVSETVVESGAPLKGCVFNFYRNGENLPAPVMQQISDDPRRNCPPEVGARFQARAESETYPQAFRDRGIEGWARVRFDLASWGEVGNVTLIDAQPAAAFGDGGVRLVRTGRAKSGFDAGIRCVAPIRYVLSQSPGAEPSSTPDNAAD